MLRVFRIIGVIVFALLIGFSAHSLKSMHASGELFEAYNSRLRADITLIGFSGLAILVLSYFELARVRRLNNRKSYGRNQFKENSDQVVEGLDSSSIYAAPKSVDDWQGRRTRSSTKYKAARAQVGDGFWMGLLKIICLVLPVLYGGLLVFNLLVGYEEPLIGILVPSAFAVLLLLSVFTAVGILKKRAWGMSLGYVLSICNLLIFPIGTGLGMFLMMVLVGASKSFEFKEKRRSRSKASARSRAAAV